MNCGVLTPSPLSWALKATAHLFRSLVKDPARDPRLRPCRIFSSGFKRSLQTCRPIAEALDLKTRLCLDLHEEGGCFEGPRQRRWCEYATVHGLNAEQMREHLPVLEGVEGIPVHGWWRGGMETLEDVAERAKRCADWLWSLLEKQGEEESGAVICISHGLFLDRWIK